MLCSPASVQSIVSRLRLSSGSTPPKYTNVVPPQFVANSAAKVGAVQCVLHIAHSMQVCKPVRQCRGMRKQCRGMHKQCRGMHKPGEGGWWGQGGGQGLHGSLPLQPSARTHLMACLCIKCLDTLPCSFIHSFVGSRKPSGNSQSFIRSLIHSLSIRSFLEPAYTTRLRILQDFPLCCLSHISYHVHKPSPYLSAPEQTHNFALHTAGTADSDLVD